MNDTRLTSNFFQRDALIVAKEILGKELVRVTSQGLISGIIVETEGYMGESDLASHARFGKTNRNQLMYKKGGRAYIYLIYGIYYNFNITAGRIDQPEAVLIRSLEPRQGLDLARNNLDKFGRVRSDKTFMTGPGKLCVALDIDKSFYGEDIASSRSLYVLDPGGKYEIESGSRIGIDYAGKYRDKPWRFFIKNNPFVSKK